MYVSCGAVFEFLAVEEVNNCGGSCEIETAGSKENNINVGVGQGEAVHA